MRIRLAAEADYRAGRSSEVLRLLDEARASGEPQAVAEALSLAHHCLLGPEHAGKRVALTDELLRVGTSTGRPSDTVMGLLLRTADLFLAGDRQAERAYAELIANEPACRNAAAAFVIRAMRVMLTIRAGRLAEAEALAEDCARAGAAAGDADWMGWYAAQVLTIRWFQGRVDELLDTVSTIVNSPTLSVVDHSFVAVQALACAATGQNRLARGALARLAGRGLEDLPGSSTWLAAMTAVVEAAALLDDRRTAGRAYQLLLPYAHLPVMASLGVACLGSAQQPLGVACLVTGDVEQAVEHLEAAVAHNSALGHWPATTLCQHRLAQALAVRNSPGDARAATGLRADAAAEAAEQGMRLPEPTGRQTRAKPPTPVWTRWGRHWRVELRGRSAVVEDMVGMRHLATLAANPGIDIPAVHLVEPDRITTAGPVAQPVLDDEALRQYRARLRELTDELGAAEERGDARRAGTLRDERNWLLPEVAAATGLGGRPATLRRRFGAGPHRGRQGHPPGVGPRRRRRRRDRRGAARLRRDWYLVPLPAGRPRIAPGPDPVPHPSREPQPPRPKMGRAVQPGSEHVRHGVGDVQRVSGPGGQALLDVDSAAPAGGEPVDDVPRAVAVELVVRPGDPHPDPGTGHGVLDRGCSLRLQPERRPAADQDAVVAEAVERHGVPEAAADYRVQRREARLVDVDGCHV